MNRADADRAASLEASKASQAQAKRENAKHTCAGHVFSDYRSRTCGKSAAHEHEGHWYCKTHHPTTVAAKRAARSELLQAKLYAEREAARAKKLAADEQKRRADCYDDLLEALRLIATAENSALDLAYCKGIARAAISKATGETA